MFSIVMPMDKNRLPLWVNSMKKYEEFGIPEGTEFVIPTRSQEVVDFVASSAWAKYCRTIPYTHELGYNPSKALNIGTRESKNPRVIITSPEVMPITNVLEQLSSVKDENIICQVFDEDHTGAISYSLVNLSFRGDHPGMYFLALFQKKDIEAINGWDEDFMLGYAWEDPDFGFRWRRAGLPFRIAEEIQARHQFHERPETIPNGFKINEAKFNFNNDNNVSRVKNGLIKEL
jgi:hypothetical protein